MINVRRIEQYRHKNAYIVNGNIFLSYETVIAASINGITFLTAATYSNTTAHHKTDAVRYFNNETVIIVTPTALYKIAEYDTETKAAAIQETTDAELLTSHVLQQSKYNAIAEHEAFINNTEFISSEIKDYKNGNSLNIRIYRTTFKNIPNFYIKQKVRAIKKTLTKNGKKYRYRDYKKYKAVIYSY